jgi:hypothetical protein
MGNVLHYWMVEPPRGGIFDDGKKQPAFEVQMKSHDGRQTDAAVFCDDSGDPEFIRVRDHGATIQTVNANADLVMVAREHVVSVLRFTWFGGGRLLPTSFYTEEPDVGSGASIRERSGFPARGGRCSEVKEEDRAQPGPGDMSGSGHPGSEIRGADTKTKEGRLTSLTPGTGSTVRAAWFPT